jgi:hypothetical protein
VAVVVMIRATMEEDHRVVQVMGLQEVVQEDSQTMETMAEKIEDKDKEVRRGSLVETRNRVTVLMAQMSPRWTGVCSNEHPRGMRGFVLC